MYIPFKHDAYTQVASHECHVMHVMCCTQSNTCQVTPKRFASIDPHDQHLHQPFSQSGQVSYNSILEQNDKTFQHVHVGTATTTGFKDTGQSFGGFSNAGFH